VSPTLGDMMPGVLPPVRALPASQSPPTLFTSVRARSGHFQGNNKPAVTTHDGFTGTMSSEEWVKDAEKVPGTPLGPHDHFDGDLDDDPNDPGDPRDENARTEPYKKEAEEDRTVPAEEGDDGARKIIRVIGTGWNPDLEGTSGGPESQVSASYTASNLLHGVKPTHESSGSASFSQGQLTGLINSVPWGHGNDDGWMGNGDHGLMKAAVSSRHTSEQKKETVSWLDSSKTPRSAELNWTEQNASKTVAQVRLQSSKAVENEEGMSATFILRRSEYTLPKQGEEPAAPVVTFLGTITLKIPKGQKISKFATPTGQAGQYLKTEDGNQVIDLKVDNFQEGKEIVLDLYSMEITWEAKPQFANVDDNPDPWRNKYVGKRIFPDNTEDDPAGNMRRELNVKVSAPGHPNQVVYLKVFDPDDPSSINDPGGILDPNGDIGGDNIIGATLTDSFGWFRPGDSYEFELLLDSNGKGQVEFIVNQQPGNNYRVAVTSEKDHLAVLQVANPSAPGFVTADDQQVVGFNGKLSPLLTVWRKLHMEVDSMAAGPFLPENKESPDRIVATGHHWEKDYFGGDVLHLSTNLTEDINFYSGGYIKAGNVALMIWTNGANTITIDNRFFGAATSDQKNLFIGPIEIYDDDDLWVEEKLLPNWTLITPGVKKTYSQAYIDIVERKINPNKSIPFENYSHYIPWFGFGPTSLNNSADYRDDSHGFWSHFIIAAYQPPKAEANDPGGGQVGGTEGITVWGSLTWYEFSAVFLETIRDTWIDLKFENSINTTLQDRIDMVVAHEIGHEPGHKSENAVHLEPGLMNKFEQTPDISAKSIRRFRQTPRWQAAW